MNTENKQFVPDFSPLDKGEREGVRKARVICTPPNLPLKRGGNAAFTLIELLIAMGIFAVFMTIITGVFTNFIQVQRRAIAQGQLISDMTSALESFIKEARTGYGSTYAGGGSEITFVNQNNMCIVYRVATTEFQRAERSISNQIDADACLDGTFFNGQESRFAPITSNSSEITTINFQPLIAKDENPKNDILENQGVITINLTAKSKKEGIPPIKIQNSVTSRQMEAYKL